MKSQHLRCAAQIGVLVLMASIGALAQNRAPERLKFKGIINAYSPKPPPQGTTRFGARGSS
jgi:hypothetical protein